MNKSTLSILILLLTQYSVSFSITCQDAVSHFKGYKCNFSQPIGEGASGKAFLVRKDFNKAEDRILKVQLVTQKGKLRRAEMERDLLYAYKHPNIIGIYRDKIEAGYMFEILEYGSGGSLETSISKNKGYFKDRINVLRAFRQLLQGVEYIHLNKKAHADLKTANVVLDSNKNIKIIDFDLAVDLGSTDLIRGTPGYMDPGMYDSFDELFIFDEFVDIYALGVILYEMTHEGKMPFVNCPKNIMIEALKKGIYTLRGGLDVEIAYLIHKCLRYNKNDRMNLNDLMYYTDLALANKAPEYLIEKVNLVFNNLDWQIKFVTLVSNHIGKYNFNLQKDIFLKNGLLVVMPVYKPMIKEISFIENYKSREQKNLAPPKKKEEGIVKAGGNGRFLVSVLAGLAILLLALLTVLIFCRAKKTGFFLFSNGSTRTYQSRQVVQTNTVRNSNRNQNIIVVRDPVVVKQPILVRGQILIKQPVVIKQQIMVKEPVNIRKVIFTSTSPINTQNTGYTSDRVVITKVTSKSPTIDVNKSYHTKTTTTKVYKS